ncbi:MAG: hypothetical protein ACLP0J_11750 [Solirubrobacteraceae bacterium]
MRRGDTLTDRRLSGQSVALRAAPRRGRRRAGPEKLSGQLAARRLRDAQQERKIANVTRHKNLPGLRRYIRNATAFDDVGEVL